MLVPFPLLLLEGHIETRLGDQVLSRVQKRFAGKRLWLAYYRRWLGKFVREINGFSSGRWNLPADGGASGNGAHLHMGSVGQRVATGFQD